MSRVVQARGYSRIAMYDFDGTLFRATESPVWWPDPTPYSFSKRPEALSAPCVPERPGREYWIPKTVQAARADCSDPGTYAVLITGRVKTHEPRIEELLAQQGIRFDKMYFNPGMSTRKFKTIVLGMLLVGRSSVEEVVIWENENHSHYAGYLEATSKALGREIEVRVHHVDAPEIPLQCGLEDFSAPSAARVARRLSG